MRVNLGARGDIIAIFGHVTGEFVGIEVISRGLSAVGAYNDGVIYGPRQ
jgi:hypothetical protein